MVRSKYRDNLNIDNRESSKHTLCHSFSCSLINSWDKFIRDYTPLNLRYEFVILIFRKFFDSKFYITKLSSTSRLLFEDSSSLSSSENSFSVSYLRFSSIYFYFMFSSKSIYDYIKVKFSHSSDHSLSTFFIRMSLE